MTKSHHSVLEESSYLFLKTVLEVKTGYGVTNFVKKNHDTVVDVYGVTVTVIFYRHADIMCYCLLAFSFLILTLTYKLTKLNMYSLLKISINIIFYQLHCAYHGDSADHGDNAYHGDCQPW